MLKGVIGFANLQVYYGEWRGQEVAVKIMSADSTKHSVVMQEVCSAPLPWHKLFAKAFTCAPAEAFSM